MGSALGRSWCLSLGSTHRRTAGCHKGAGPQRLILRLCRRIARSARHHHSTSGSNVPTAGPIPSQRGHLHSPIACKRRPRPAMQHLTGLTSISPARYIPRVGHRKRLAHLQSPAVLTYPNAPPASSPPLPQPFSSKRPFPAGIGK